MRRSPPLSLMFLAFATRVIGEQSTTATVIPDAPTCPSCRITITPTITLGEADGAGSFSWAPYLSVDAKGRYWMFAGKDYAGGPAIFGADGRFIQEVGRRGQGPGEHEHLSAVIHLPGDSVLLIDSNTRGTLLGPDLTPKRYLRMPSSLSRAQLIRWPDSIFAFSHYAGGGRGGPTLHIVTADSDPARVTGSFGSEWSMRDINTMQHTMQTTSVGRSGVWSGLSTRYHIELWNPRGQLLRSLDRKPEWFAGVSRGLGSRDAPPGPTFTALHEDNAGRLWTFIAVAAPTWREGWPRGEGELRIAAFNLDKMYRTIIEVIDPAAGRVIARQQLDEWIVGVLPDGRAIVNFVDQNDVNRVRIVKLTLEGLR